MIISAEKFVDICLAVQIAVFFSIELLEIGRAHV